MKANKIPDADRAHIESVPWLAKHLNDTDHYHAIPTFSRVLKPNGEDYFFSATLNNDKTIPYQITLVRKDLNTPPDASTLPVAPTTTSHKLAYEAPQYPDNYMLMHLARPGMDGHPNTMHGGMLCAILDETMGLTVMLHHSKKEKGARESLYTLELKTTYRAAVPTPSDVLVRCWLTRKEGRKWWARGQIVNQEGVVMTEAEGLWLSTIQRVIAAEPSPRL